MNKNRLNIFIYKESKNVLKAFNSGLQDLYVCFESILYLGPGQHLWVGRNSCQDLTQHDPERENIDLQIKRAKHPRFSL